MENINELQNLLTTFNSMLQNKDFTDLLSLNKQQNQKQLLSFTQKEIDKMPKTFKKEFRTDGCTAHIYKRKTSKNSYTYDIKYRRNGYNVIASNKNLEKAKQQFIEKLKTAEKVYTNSNKAPSTFNAFAMFYFEKFRKRKVAEITYKIDLRRYNNHLKPYFNEKPLSKITSLECQNLLDKHTECGQGKTADELYSLMSVIFKSAIAHDIIKKNPLNIVFHQKHVRKNGTALTKKEEKILLDSTAGTDYQFMFAIALYTGMRPNEYSTAKRDGDFIVCKNSKRKGGKIEYKKIPITPMLMPYIDNSENIKFYCLNTLRKKFNEILPNHIPYDMRTTFYTRCEECGIADVAKKLFVGHSLGELANAYTDMPDEFLLKEGKKFKYDYT